MTEYLRQTVHRVASGIVITVAGKGQPGYAGDGGPAVEAFLNEPKNVALDPQGSLLIADSENHVIRRVDGTTGIIETVVGEPSGEVHANEGQPFVDSSDGDVFDGSSLTAQPYTQRSDISGTVCFLSGGG